MNRSRLVIEQYVLSAFRFARGNELIDIFLLYFASVQTICRPVFYSQPPTSLLVFYNMFSGNQNHKIGETALFMSDFESEGPNLPVCTFSALFEVKIDKMPFCPFGSFS